MITVTAQFNTVEEAAEFLRRVGGPTITVDIDRAPVAVQGDVGQKPRRGRPKIERTEATEPPASTQPAAPAPAPAAPPVQVPFNPVAPGSEQAPVAAAPKVPNAPVQAVAQVQAASAHPATLDGVRMALREVFNKNGATVATNILKKFAAARISDVKATDYAAFLVECANPTVPTTLPVTPTA